MAKLWRKRVRVRRRRGSAVDDPADVPWAQASPPFVAEQCGIVRLDDVGSHPSPRPQRGDQQAPTAGPVAGPRLSPHDHGALVEVDRRGVEAAQLADSQPRAVQDLQHRVVATAPPGRLVVGEATLEQRVEVAMVEHVAGGPSPPLACTPVVGSAVNRPVRTSQRKYLHSAAVFLAMLRQAYCLVVRWAR